MYNEDKMCFMTVANKPYQKYIPWFVYYLNRAYPKAHKLILLDVDLTDDVEKALKLLHGNFEVRANAFPEYTETNPDTIKCLRWLFYEPSLEQYDCIAIGDVDMAIYAEDPSYMIQHMKHCDMLGIPYSNFVRPPHAGPRRVGGINVVKPREWFKSMLPVIMKYRPMLKSGTINLPQHGFNEQLLLKMIIESELGEPPANLSETYWSSLVTSNHHGTHIRLAEFGGIEGLKGANGYLKHKDEILAAVETKLFKQISDIFPEIGNMLLSIANAYRQF